MLAVLRRAFETARAEAAAFAVTTPAMDAPREHADPLSGRHAEMNAAIQADLQQIEPLKQQVRTAKTASEFAWLLIFILVITAGCESTPPHRTAPAPSVRSFDNIQRVAIIAFDTGGVALVEQRSQPGRTLDEVLSWHPYGAALRPLAALVHRGVNSVRARDQEIVVEESVRDVAAGRIIAEAMAQRLRASGSLDEVSVLASEGNGAGHETGEAIVRLTVTSWGLVRVRQDPDLFSSFADVTGLLAVSGTGVALWEHHEDVTGPDLIPFDAFRWDPTFTREQILNVLARAGERFAAEFLYARGSNR